MEPVLSLELFDGKAVLKNNPRKQNGNAFRKVLKLVEQSEAVPNPGDLILNQWAQSGFSGVVEVHTMYTDVGRIAAVQNWVEGLKDGKYGRIRVRLYRAANPRKYSVPDAPF